MDFDFDIKEIVVSNFLFAVFYVTIEGVLAYLTNSIAGNLPSPFQNAFPLIASFILVFVTFTILNMRRTSTVGLTTYLFWPQGSKSTTLKEHESYQHRIIVNTKRTPAIAYPITPKTYVWKFVKKHPEIIHNLTDTAMHDGEHDKKWAEKQGYRFEPKSPDRENLLASDLNISSDVGIPLDPKLFHIHARFFLLPHTNRTNKRAIFNRITMKAWAFDTRIMYELDGRIRKLSGYWWPIPHYVQLWAWWNHYHWSKDPVMMSDLLATEDENAVSKKT